MDEKYTIDIDKFKKESLSFNPNAKNKILIRVLLDNQKVLERRIIPLIELFKVETTFFKDI